MSVVIFSQYTILFKARWTQKLDKLILSVLIPKVQELVHSLQRKLILHFVCTYYLGVLPKVHSIILSIQIIDTTPVERIH